MRLLARQAFANLRSRRLHAALVLATLTVSAVLLTVGLAAREATRDPWQRLFDITDGAHLWLHLDGDRIDGELADSVGRTLPEVVGSTGAIPTVEVELAGVVSGVFGQLAVREWPGARAIARPLLVEGRAPRPGSDEVVLDRNVAADEGLRVGEVVEVPQGGEPLALEVVGLAVRAEACPYPVCGPTAVWLGEGALTDFGLVPPPVPGILRYSVGLRLADPGRASDVEDVVAAEVPDGALIYTESAQETSETVAIGRSFQAAFLVAFAAMSMLVAGVLIGNAVAAGVRADRARIGVLKAVGMTGRQLTNVYLVETLTLASLASAVGVAIGAALAPSLLAGAAQEFGFDTVRVPVAAIAIPPAAVLALATLCTVVPVRAASRMSAVTAIRGGSERRRGRMRALPRRPLALAQALADLAARPVRSLLTGLGLTVGVIAVTFVILADSGLGAYTGDPGYSPIGWADLYVRRSPAVPQRTAEEMFSRDPAVREVVGDYLGHFSFAGSSEVFAARFRSGEDPGSGFGVVEGSMFERPDEAVVGFGLARRLGIRPGQTTQVLLMGEPTTVTVTGVIRDIVDLGETMTMPIEAALRIDPDVEPFDYWLRLESGADPVAVAARLAAASNDGLQAIVSDGSAAPGFLGQIRTMLFRLSGLLGVVVAVGVASTVVISVRERRRDFALLKAVGMRPGEVTASVLVGASVLAAAAYLVGLPAGILASRSIMDGVGRSTGFGPFISPGPVVPLALVLPLLLALALAAAWIPARSAGRHPVTTVLRHE